MEEKFATRDIWAAASLSIQLKVKPLLRNEDGIVLFCFKSSKKLAKAVNDYYSGGVLSAISYSEQIKQLRHQMYAARNQG